MTISENGIPANDREIMILSVMKATGLPRESVEELMSDTDLDDLCDAVLSDLASPPKKVGDTEA